MNTFLLTWNPATSDYRMEQFERDIAMIAQSDTSEITIAVDDSIEIDQYDRFFAIRVGKGGYNGIVMAGYIISNAYDGDESKGQRPDRLYVDVDVLQMIHTEMAPMVSLKRLQEVMPTFEWSNLMECNKLSDEEAEAIEMEWLKYLYENQDIYDGIKAVASWEYDIEDFETVPEAAQRFLKRKYGCKCEDCELEEDEDTEGHEFAYHLILPEDGDCKRHPLKSVLHCYCDECWFNGEE